MAVKMRLKRMGAKKRPFYRIVVADSRFPRDGRFIEEIGYYNPIVDNLDKQTELTSIFNYLDVKLKALEKKHKIHYISIYEEFKQKPYYLPNPSHAFPSLEGYNYIANEIIEELD